MPTDELLKQRDDWIAQVTNLVDDVSKWSNSRNWSFSRSEKSVTEERIGTYVVPCLTVQTPAVRIHIDPKGFGIIGADGRVDILAYPSMNRLLLVRKNNEWQLFTDSRVAWPQSWSEETFVDISDALAV